MISRLSLSLLEARDRLTERYRSVLTREGLTEPQWRVLSTLAQQTELDATRLSEQAAIQPPSLTRMVQGLEARGLVVSRRDPNDGRRALMTLTPEGRGLAEAIAPRIAAVEDGVLAAFGAERARALTLALEALSRALESSERA